MSIACRIALRGFVLSSVLVMFSLVASGQEFSDPLSYPLLPGSDPLAVVVADFNGDGATDAAFASNYVPILLNDGRGRLRTRLDEFSVKAVVGLAAGDFDGDGRVDLAATTLGNQVHVLLGNGDGTFQAPQPYDAGGSGIQDAVTAVDVNGDGRLDLAAIVCTTRSNPCYASILLGNGDGSFQPGVLYALGNGPQSIAAGDFNADGAMDLVVTIPDNGSVAILLGEGDGTFQLAVRYSAGDYLTSVTVGDLNGDGYLDLAPTNQSVTEPSISLLFGNGDGTFEPPIPIALDRNPTRIVAADVNGDGT